MNLERYYRENWGAPFVIAFIVLLIMSVVEYGIGSSHLANSFAIVAFFMLVVGAGLQLASFIKNGDVTLSPRPETVKTSIPVRRRSRRVLIIAGVSVALILGASLAAAWFFHGYYASVTPRVTPPVTSVLTVVSSNVTTTYGVTVTHLCPGCAPLSVTYVNAHSSKEPDGTVLAAFTVSVQGGSPPYSFTARWGDGFNQTNTIGAFQRIIPANQTSARTAVVTVTSADGQKGNITVTVPPPS